MLHAMVYLTCRKSCRYQCVRRATVVQYQTTLSYYATVSNQC